MKLEDVTYTYSPGTAYEMHALEHINLEIPNGQFVGIIGHTGSGKSTLVQHLNGLIRPTLGRVLYNGEDIWKEGYPLRELRSHVGLVFQYPEHQLFETDVITDVCFGPKNQGLSPEECRKRAEEALDHVGFPKEMYEKSPFELSGGQKRRVAIAGVLAMRPDVLILDEPTNHLDIFMRETLTDALSAYTGTLLLVTHDRHLMNSLACPILYLEDGKAVLYPSYDALMGRAAPAQAAQKAAEPAKTGYGKEQRRRRAELRAKIKACEDEMEACGAREVELDNEINSPEVYNDPDLLRQKSDELSDLRFHQEELFAAWEAAMEEQESYEQSQTEE